MSEWNKDGDAALDAELAKLRDALNKVNATDGSEESLRGAFRARYAAGVQAAHATSTPSQPERATTRSRAVGRRYVDFIAGAVAASVAVAAVVLIGLGRNDRDGAESVAVAARDGSTLSARDDELGAIAAATAFQPLAYSREISPTQAYTIVRVRLPLTALGVGYDVPPNATIEADLLLGEDGIPTGIRFDTTDAQLVSMASH